LTDFRETRKQFSAFRRKHSERERDDRYYDRIKADEKKKVAPLYSEKRITNVGHERGTKSPAAVCLLGMYPPAREIFGPEINSGHISRAKARESSYRESSSRFDIRNNTWKFNLISLFILAFYSSDEEVSQGISDIADLQVNSGNAIFKKEIM